MATVAEAGLEAFYSAAVREYEVAVECEGVVERYLRFGDCRVRLRFAGGGLAGALLPALAQRRDDAGGAVHATIDLWEESACPRRPVPFPWGAVDIGPGGLVRGSELDRVVAVHETYSGALTLVDRAELALLHRVPDGGAVPWWERAAPLRPALFWALGGEGRHLVHAGAVGDDRGGVLLAGASGSGKTTVALAALVHGLGYLADDYVLLHAAGEPTANSIYTTASVAGTPQVEGKAVLDVAVSLPGSLRESLPVRAVLVPRIRGGRARLRRASPADALRAWAPDTALHMPFDDGAVVAVLAALVRGVPCFTLDVGDDVGELAGAVDQALELARS